MNIFLSRPTWIEPHFEAGLRAFISRLTDAGLVPRTLGKSDYPLAAPMDEVLSLLAECRGAIVLGYPQILVSTGHLRGVEIESPMSMCTEWNHIEAALAYAQKLPMMMIHHLGVSRGVFDRGVLSGFVYGIDLTDPLWSQEEQIGGALATWRTRVAAYGTREVAGHVPASPSAPKDSQPCPNCSTPERPFFMSKLERDFQQLTGSTHICNRCKSTFDFG